MAGDFALADKARAAGVKKRAAGAQQPDHDRGQSSDAFFTGCEGIA